MTRSWVAQGHGSRAGFGVRGGRQRHTYLTEGDQHSIDVINGHRVNVRGGGSIGLSEAPQLGALLGALEWARSAEHGSNREI